MPLFSTSKRARPANGAVGEAGQEDLKAWVSCDVHCWKLRPGRPEAFAIDTYTRTRSQRTFVCELIFVERHL
jgi:hypothetical protein